MSRLDLIIDALESAHHTNDTGVMGLTKLRHDVALAAARDLRQELAKPEQEPYFCKDCGKGLLGEGHIHTCSPQVKRQWVGLTEDERFKIATEMGALDAGWIEFAFEIEKNVRLKNT